MVKHRQEALTILTLSKVTAILAVGVIMSFSTPTWATPKGPYGAISRVAGRESRNGPIIQPWDTIKDNDEESIHTYIARKKKPSSETVGDPQRNRKNYRDLSSDEKDKFKRKRMEWEALPPEKQKVLRQRMQRLKELPPEDRELFRQRFNQWKRLPPEERQRIRQDLDRWDRLPPQERDQIRRRFLPQ
jgi:hypothetical protein